MSNSRPQSRFKSRLSYCAAQARLHDYDRYLAALFAPAAAREGVFALLAFNLEVAKTREAVTEPLLGQIRLQWWREAIAEVYDDGVPRRHQVLTPLAEAIRAHNLPRRAFDRLIDAREADLDDAPPASLGALMTYLDDTAGGLFELAAIMAGARDAASAGIARSVGRVWGLTGLIRAIPFHARQQRSFIPEDIAESAGLHPAQTFQLQPSDELAAAVRLLADEAVRRLASARAGWPQADPAALSAVLPAAIADRYLRQVRQRRFDVMSRPIALGRLRRQWLLWRAARRKRI